MGAVGETGCLPFLSRALRRAVPIAGGSLSPLSGPVGTETLESRTDTESLSELEGEHDAWWTTYPMDIEEADKWLVSIAQPKQQSAYRLVMLPWVGADARAMREAWQGVAGWEDDTHVLAVELPGRGTRRNEVPLTDVRAMASAIAEALDVWGYLRRNAPPLLLWGHSTLGAMLAVHTSHVIRRREEAKARRMGPYNNGHNNGHYDDKHCGGPTLARVIVSGAPPIHDLEPASPSVLSMLHADDEEEEEEALLRHFLTTRGRRRAKPRSSKPGQRSGPWGGSPLPAGLTREQLRRRVLDIVGTGVRHGPLISFSSSDLSELQQWVLPCLRADLLAVETYKHANAPPLLCPLLAMCGTRDDVSVQRSIHRWRCLTSSFNLSYDVSGSPDDVAWMVGGGDDGFVVGGYGGGHFWEGQGKAEVGLVMGSVIKGEGERGEQGGEEQGEEGGHGWEQEHIEEGWARLETEDEVGRPSSRVE